MRAWTPGICLWLFAVTLGTGAARADDFLFTAAEAECAAEMIFMNECSGKDKNLLYWSPDEAFPSLGIAHFIWYPKNAAEPYLETFPAFLDFAQELGLAVPAWIAATPEKHCPWAHRHEFLVEAQGERVQELRKFLRDTKTAQAQFILRRFMRVFPKILDDLDPADRKPVREKYDLLMRSRAGAFAMVDYVNFKGEGFHADARYEGVGWGLGQVLVEMEVPDDPENAVEAFIAAGEKVLERRVLHAPRPEVEARWLPGWKARLRRYSKLNC